MKGATPFLHIISERETALIEAIFSSKVPYLPPEK
jgi:hypothetical protein